MISLQQDWTLRFLVFPMRAPRRAGQLDIFLHQLAVVDNSDHARISRLLACGVKTRSTELYIK